MPSSIENVAIWYMENGTAVPQVQVPEGTSQTYKRGHLVSLSSGVAVEAVAAGSNLTSSGNEIYAIAMQDASGVAGTVQNFARIVPGLRQVVPVTHATAASAVTAATQRGSVFQLENVTGKGYACAIDDTATPVVTVVKIHPQYPVGEQYGWVEVAYIFTEMQIGTA